MELNEPVLADDYPVYANYLYVADGKVIVSDLHGGFMGMAKLVRVAQPDVRPDRARE